MPRYIDLAPTSPAGLRAATDLPEPLPHAIEPRGILRCIEDLHQLLHDLNSQLHDKKYERLEELLDPAGFSGMLSRAVVDNLAKQVRALAKNEYHNGYPDLVPHGVYPQNKVQHGDSGLEVKATRYEASCQAHGERAGWFCVVQFAIDKREDVAIQDREPTAILAVMVAELEKDDWAWAPAKEGRIRSGTASVKPSGWVKLRAGAVWVEPAYEARHQELLADRRLKQLRDKRVEYVMDVFTQGDPSVELSAADLRAAVAAAQGLPDPDRLTHQVSEGVKALIADGRVTRVRPGVFRLTPSP